MKRLWHIALWFLAACGEPAGSPAEVALEPQLDHGETVVAKVNGAPILGRDLAEQMRSGQPRREALQALIQAELLAQEAARRGLARHPEVRRAQRRAMANLLTQRGFGERYTKASIPRSLLEKAYQQNRAHFDRPELVRVTHILVQIGQSADEMEHKRALGVAREIREIARSGKLSPDEFRQIAGLMRERHKWLRLRIETLNTPRRGFTVNNFADAAFNLKRPGDISPVVATRFGYHVIYLIDRIPAKHVTLEQADAELRDLVYDQAKQQAFNSWLDKLAKRYRVRTYPERLEEKAHATRSTPGSKPK